MSPWTIGWLAVLSAAGALELAALLNKAKQDTLSEHIWSWFSVRGHGKLWQLRRALLVASLGWLVAHLLTGGWV